MYFHMCNNSLFLLLSFLLYTLLYFYIHLYQMHLDCCNASHTVLIQNRGFRSLLLLEEILKHLLQGNLHTVFHCYCYLPDLLRMQQNLDLDSVLPHYLIRCSSYNYHFLLHSYYLSSHLLQYLSVLKMLRSEDLLHIRKNNF